MTESSTDYASSARLVVAMCLAETFGMIGTFAFPTLLPHFLGIWDLTHTQAGWINGVYFAGYTAAVPILVSLTDRMDARRIYLAFSGVGALSALGFAFFADGFWTALLFRALAGLGLAGTFIPGLRAIVDRLEGNAQARSISFYTATFSLGVSLSFFATGKLNVLLGWRWAFGCGAVGSVISLFIVAMALRPVIAAPTKADPSHLLDFRPVFRNRTAMAYIYAYAAHMWELFAFRSWTVAFLAFSLSLQPPDAIVFSPSSVAALTALAAMWGNILGAELALRFNRRKVLTLIMGGSAIYAFGMGFTAALPYPMIIVLIIVYAMFVQGDSGALHTGVVLSADPERRGMTLALQSLLGFACSFVGPVAVGAVLDATGSGHTVFSWGVAFIAMGVVVALGPLFLNVMIKK